MKTLPALISELAHQGSQFRLTTEPDTLRDLGGNERVEYFTRKACDLYICKCDSGVIAGISRLFSLLWFQPHPKEAQIVGRILWQNCRFDFAHIVAYDPNFEASLEIKRSNGWKIHIYKPSEEYQLDHRFFSWNPTRKTWNPAD